MKQTYKEIVKIINKVGINSELDNIPVKVIDLENEILVYDPVSGWLSLRRQIISTNEISEVSKANYFNKVIYKDSETPYCLEPELRKVFNQILSCND